MVRSGDRGALAALLSGNPALASAVDDDGVPLLHAAAETDDARMVEAVLDGGAHVDVIAPWGQTALEWAANLGARRSAEVLLDRGCRLGLWTAAALGEVDAVRRFLEEAGREEGDGSPSGGPGTSAPGAETASASGAVAPSLEGVGRKPVAGADLSGWPADTPYRRGDHVSDAFYIACRNGALDVAELLFAAGADVDATGYFGATALHWTAINGHARVAEWLVEQGADVGRRDPKFDATPAGWAREGGHDALADRLAEAGSGR